MLLRSLFSALILLSIAAGAVAQTTPVRKTTKTTARRTTTKTRATNTTVQAQPASGARQDTGPAGNGAVGSADNADSKGQNIYAAPGEPINLSNPKKVEGYNGPAPTKPRTGTTLTPR